MKENNKENPIKKEFVVDLSQAVKCTKDSIVFENDGTISDEELLEGDSYDDNE